MNNNHTPQQVSPLLKTCRARSILFMIGAIAYFFMPFDFDKVGLKGYVDDFFLFMAAFTFLHGSWQKPERYFIRKQLYTIATVFLVMAMVWVWIMGTFMAGDIQIPA